MTCKCTDCIHYDVCEKRKQGDSLGYNLDIDNSMECDNFQNKSNIFFFQSSFNNNEIYVILKNKKGKYVLCGVKANYLNSITFDNDNILISYNHLINKINQDKTIQWIIPHYEFSYSLDYKDFNKFWFFDKELAIKELKRRNENDL